MPTFPARRLTTRHIATLALGVALSTGGAALLPAAASANSSQLEMIQDPADMVNAPATLEQFRELGANAVRVIVRWSAIAPNSTSRKKPKFNANDPNAYPAANWAPYDNLVRTAVADHLKVDFTLSGGAPRWAEGAGIPPGNTPFFSWKPNAADYGQFVHAVGERYDGHFTPNGASSTLPAVRFWAIYNEPNFGEDLGPQAIKGSKVSVAPMMYRKLVSAGWKALHATGHGHDTILIGEFAARGLSGPVTRSHPAGPAGQPVADQAAAVHPHPLLREHQLPRAARGRGQGGGLSDERRGVAQVPRAEPGAVQRQRCLGPPVPDQRLARE